MDEIKAQVEAARKEGYTDDEIRNYLSSSEDPAHKEYAKTFGQQNDQSDYKMAPPPSQGPATPLLNAQSNAAQAFSDLPVNKQLAIGAGAAAGLTGLGLVGYAGKEYIKNKIANANTNPEFKRQNDLIAQKNAIAERNIALQEQNLGQPTELSPLEQARVEVEKAKAERIRQQLEMDKQLHEHKIKTLAQKATKAITPTPEELQAATAHEGAQSGEIIKKALGPVDSRQTAEIIGKSLGMKTADELAAQSPVAPPTQTNAPVAPTQPSTPQSMGPNVTEDNWANQTPQEVAQAKAPEAPIPQATSPQEAQTIATVQKAAETPTERISAPSTEVKGAIKPLMTGSGMPAIQGTAPPGTKFKSNFAGPHELPETHVFVPGGQYMDTVRNGVGQEAFTASLKNAGGYPQTQKEAEALSRSINENMGRLPRDVAKELRIGLGEGTKGITRAVSGKKLVQMGGIPGAIIAAADLANAGQSMNNKDTQMAVANASQLLNMVPVFGPALGSLLTTTPEELEALRRIDKQKKK